MPSRKAQLTFNPYASLWWENAIKTWEIAMAAPQVIAHRTARMSAAGGRPNARDQKEFALMGQEKLEAFGESLVAMSAPFFKINQELAMLALREWWKMWASPSLMAGYSPSQIAKAYASFMRNFAMGASSKQLQESFSHMVGKGLVPIHRRATANAKRLAGLKGK